MNIAVGGIHLTIPALPGWCSPEKAHKFVEHILTNKPALCVEIGVYGGSSLIPQALALQHNQCGLAVGVDPWTRAAALEGIVSQQHRGWWGTPDYDKLFCDLLATITKLWLDEHCRLIRDKSENVVAQFADESIDLLHIDGNHSEAPSLRDATLYLPKVKPGGLIYFDDVCWGEAGQVTVKKALIHLLGGCKLIDIVTSCFILRKD